MGADECGVNKPFSTSRYTYIAIEDILAVVVNIADKFFVEYRLNTCVLSCRLSEESTL